eukprot:scaffold148_cov371-Prasinococcus_capsulatus_cf.AAC.23
MAIVVRREYLPNGSIRPRTLLATTVWHVLHSPGNGSIPWQLHLPLSGYRVVRVPVESGI